MIADLTYVTYSISMDHLGDNFFSARLGRHKVRLFAELQPTLEESFHTLHRPPGPIGWIIEDDGRYKPCGLASQGAIENNGQPNSALTKFVQRWLWLEVLRRILGHLHDFNISDFIKKDPGENQLITTTKLPLYLKRWQKFEADFPNRRRQVQAHLILEQARIYVFRYCAVSGDQKYPAWPIDRNVALSIMVPGETLTTALIRIQQATNFNVRGWHNHKLSTQGWGYSSVVLENLRLENVCPQKIYMLKGLFQNNTVGLLYALQLLPRAVPGELHDRCDAKQCRAVQCYLPGPTGNQPNVPRVRGDPEPIHLASCNKETCRQIGPDIKKLCRIIEKGKIPLLQYDKTTTTVKLVAKSESIHQEYVTFSHVWADGYGNPNANVLNQCVLDLFMQLFEDIRRSSNTSTALERFWIDTLAIPVQAEHRDQRKTAIKSMNRIYKGAQYTVVLDAGLMSVSRGEGYAQAAMSISVSRWMTRLWTLQEAVLSKELYFNFSDDIVSMDRLEDQYPEEHEPLHSIVSLVSRTYLDGIMRKESRAIHALGSSPEDSKFKPGFVAAAWRALQWRTTTHLQHETLALATLLDVDTDNFADSSNTNGVEDVSQIGRRMQKLLKLLGDPKPCSIPAGMIFLPGPRLSEKGYRWAPRTWLSSGPVEAPDALSLKCHTAQLMPPLGLQVKFPGFLLHKPRKTEGLFTHKIEFYFPTGLSLGQWYCICRADEEAEKTDEEAEKTDDLNLAIIAPQLPVINDREIALLVAVKKISDKIIFVEILNRVWIKEVDDPERTKELKNAFLTADPDSWSWGEIISDEDYWCVDGVEEVP